MKLYLDDVRSPTQTYHNDSDWFVVRNYNEFVSAIEKHFSDLEIISFDNDIANFDSDGYRDWETDRKSTRLNSSHRSLPRMPSSA